MIIVPRADVPDEWLPQTIRHTSDGARAWGNADAGARNTRSATMRGARRRANFGWAHRPNSRKNRAGWFHLPADRSRLRGGANPLLWGPVPL